MRVDREQIRRDAEAAIYTSPGDPMSLARHCLALLIELEQAEKQANCDCVPCIISSKSCRKCGRRAIITQEQFVSSVSELEARLAKVPALVEAHKRIVALPVPRAVEAIEISDAALAAWEQE